MCTQPAPKPIQTSSGAISRVPIPRATTGPPISSINATGYTVQPGMPKLTKFYAALGSVNTNILRCPCAMNAHPSPTRSTSKPIDVSVFSFNFFSSSRVDVAIQDSSQSSEVRSTCAVGIVAWSNRVSSYHVCKSHSRESAISIGSAIGSSSAGSTGSGAGSVAGSSSIAVSHFRML
jgi:hypothetical protein